MKNADWGLDRDIIWSADRNANWRFDEVCQGLHPTLKMRQMHKRMNGDAKKLHLTLKQSDALTGFRFCQRTAFWWSNALANFRYCQKTAFWWSNALTGLTMMSKKLHSDARMHWRIFDIVRKTALWWSNALTGFSVLLESCIWRWNDQMHWRIDYDLAISVTDVMARFWLYDAGRQAGERIAKRQTSRKQTNKTKRQKWNDACWLLKQASWFAKK